MTFVEHVAALQRNWPEHLLELLPLAKSVRYRKNETSPWIYVCEADDGSPREQVPA